MDKRWFFLLAGIFVAALLVRGFGINAFPGFREDELLHRAAAVNYTLTGNLGPDNWFHPPLKHLVHQVSLTLFGNVPLSLRLVNVTTGAATCLLVFIFARTVLSLTTGAWLAAGLMVLWPLHIRYCRTSYEDIPATLFLVTALLTFCKAHERRDERLLLLTGILLGLAVAFRLYCANVLLFLTAVSIVIRRSEGFAAAVWRQLTYLCGIPLLIYVTCFSWWFMRGYTFIEWIQMQQDALRMLSGLKSEHFPGLAHLGSLGSPAHWFLGTMDYALEMVLQPGLLARYILTTNNLPVAALTLPALAGLGIYSWRQRSLPGLVLVGTFVSLYVPFLFISRPLFIYTALPLIPLALIAIGFSVEKVCRDVARPVALVMLLWCLLLYPLVVGIPVPMKVYQPLLQKVRVVDMVRG